jgi:IS4 transposase
MHAGWRGARWLDGNGKPFDIVAALVAAESTGVLDSPIWIARKKAPPLALRLVAFRKPPEAAEKSRAKARQAAKREGYAITGGTLAAAEWVILVTSLKAENWSSAGIGELYRAQWRIEMAFKRLKLVPAKAGKHHWPVGTAWRRRKRGQNPRFHGGRLWILAHLLMILLLEPHTSAPEVSPRMAA